MKQKSLCLRHIKTLALGFVLCGTQLPILASEPIVLDWQKIESDARSGVLYAQAIWSTLAKFQSLLKGEIVAYDIRGVNSQGGWVLKDGEIEVLSNDIPEK